MSKIDYKAINDKINQDFGFDIFQGLLGTIPKNRAKIRLFDESKTSQDIFYHMGKFGFPMIHNFSSGETYTPITAYAKAHQITNKEAFYILAEEFKLLDTKSKGKGKKKAQTFTLPKEPIYKPSKEEKIPLDTSKYKLKERLLNRSKSALSRFLVSLFGNDLTNQVSSQYHIGGNEFGKYDTSFYYQDSKGDFVSIKSIAYNPKNGKRIKEVHPPIFSKGYNCFFGEHLVKNDTKEIWIVESEKTALITAIYFLIEGIQDKICVACGGIKKLNKAFENTTLDLSKYRFLLVPDTDRGGESFKDWFEACLKIKESFDINIEVSKFLEGHANDFQKEKKFDLADFLISEHIKGKSFHNLDLDFYLAAPKPQPTPKKDKEDFEPTPFAPKEPHIQKIRAEYEHHKAMNSIAIQSISFDTFAKLYGSYIPH